MQMGTPEDMTFRRAHPWKDGVERQENVARAMKVIYSGNRAVNGDPVKRILRDSNAPTMVRGVFYTSPAHIFKLVGTRVLTYRL